MQMDDINKSLELQQQIFDKQLILNPVENCPFQDILVPCSSYLHGLYNTDTVRNNQQKFQSKIQFSGRNQITEDIQKIYKAWANLLDAERISMRLLSGLHAHTILFMGLSSIGDKVMILPEKAGGHVSGKAILQRLGLVLEDIPYDTKKRCIDHERYIEQYKKFNPDFVFVDRSEGLVYEDFTWLCSVTECYKIFDASQYLTNILVKDYITPFEMGFDLVISTMHKNLPGPQRAFIASKKADEKWDKLRSAISTYVSNMHVFSIYSAGLLLNHLDELKQLSKNMLTNAVLLEQQLEGENIPIVQRETDDTNPPTHHCWIKPPTKEKAFQLYLDLEKIGILTNYRLLPYDIGYGLRLGLSGATMSGLTPNAIPDLCKIISRTYYDGYSEKLHKKSLSVIESIKKRNQNS
jgi:glycine hydroxymethyltransferase